MDAPGKVPDSINCHSCNTVIDLAGQQAFNHVDCAQCGALSVVPVQFGNFLLLQPLGVGGMGTVYKAIDLSLNRYLALKILRKKLASKPEFIESFSREARAAAAVNHPNIAQVYSFGEFESQYYLAMELLERGSLDDRISTLGKIPEKDVLEIGQQISSGLRAAQSRNLLHRDIKPGNILFGEDSVPKLVDFGLARAQQEANQKSSEPIWGTPYYIAPEKLRGQTEDLRSDMYSLGATLFHALAGRPPFDAATASEVVTKQATQPAYSLKTYAPGIQDYSAHVIGRMLSKNPAERYETYDELVHDFNEAIATVKLAEQNKYVTASSGEKVALKSVLATLAVVVVGVVIVGLVWANRATIFDTSVAPPPPPPSVTNTNVATPPAPPPVVNAGAEVDFAEEAPWAKAWNRAILQLTQGKFQEALIDFDSARRLLGSGQAKHRQWIAYFEGLTQQAMDRPSQSLASFVKARSATATKQVPEQFTTATIIDLLAFLMTGEVPVAEVETAAARMPGWAAALTYLSGGFKNLETGRIDQAADSFRRYLKLPTEPEQRWAFNLKPLAEKIVRECDRMKQLLAELDQLQKDGQLQEALEKTNAALSRSTTLNTLRPPLVKRRDELTGALAKKQEQEGATRVAEEEERRQRDERERTRAEEEAKLVQALEPDIAPLLQRYDFAALQQRYEAFAPTVQTPAGQQLLRTRIAMAKLLGEFKNQLAADFRAKPYDAAALRTRGGVQLVGNISRATNDEVFYTTAYGEIAGKWSELPPAALMKMAATYATAFAGSENGATQGQRYLRLAVFCKSMAQEKAGTAYAQKAVQLSPGVQEQVKEIFGEIAGAP